MYVRQNINTQGHQPILGTFVYLYIQENFGSKKIGEFDELQEIC